MRLFRPRLQQLLIPLALLASFSHSVLAKANHEGWYQVEMIIFARQNPTTQETWPKDIKLRYPNNWVELKDPNSSLTAPPSSDATPEASNTAGNPAATAITEAVPPTPVDLTREAYWQLPTNEFVLSEQVRRLQQNPHYQVLFHQAWRQVITNRKAATNILIFGGETYGQHFQLEGSINLSVATYLKLVTNLWLTNFVASAPEDLSIADQPSQDPEAPKSQSVPWPELPARPNLKPELPPATDQLSASLDGEPFANETSTNLMSPAQEEELPAYSPSRILLMKQERDMRSREIHYLDHPVLGVIIKIVPYKASAGDTKATDPDQDLLPSDQTDLQTDASQ